MGYKGVGLEGGSACDFHFDGGWRMTGSAPRGTVSRQAGRLGHLPNPLNPLSLSRRYSFFTFENVRIPSRRPSLSLAATLSLLSKTFEYLLDVVLV